MMSAKVMGRIGLLLKDGEEVRGARTSPLKRTGAAKLSPAVLLNVPEASAPLPKFVIHCGTSDTNFGSKRGTSKHMILVPLFDLKFLKSVCRSRCRNFKSAALSSIAR